MPEPAPPSTVAGSVALAFACCFVATLPFHHLALVPLGSARHRRARDVRFRRLARADPAAAQGRLVGVDPRRRRLGRLRAYTASSRSANTATRSSTRSALGDVLHARPATRRCTLARARAGRVDARRARGRRRRCSRPARPGSTSAQFGDVGTVSTFLVDGPAAVPAVRAALAAAVRRSACGALIVGRRLHRGRNADAEPDVLARGAPPR